MGKTKVEGNASNSSDVNGYEVRLASLERRLAVAERTLEFVRASRLGSELRMLELGQRQRALDSDAERDLEQKRIVAAADRADVFKRFARERIAKHPDLSVTQRELFVRFNDWALENGVPKLHRFESVAELQAAVKTTFSETEGIQPADVPSPGYLGTHPLNVPGYVGIDLVAEGEDPAEVLKTLNAETARDDAQRKARHEDHQLAASIEDAIIDTRRTRDDAARVTVEAARTRQ